MNVAQSKRLRDLAFRLATGTLRRPWLVQTSNSFRRIGTDDGDGNVLCATLQKSDGHPDLHAAPGVLDYIVAAHPTHVLELMDQRDHAWRALDFIRTKIAEGNAAAFAEAEALRLGAPMTAGAAEPPDDQIAPGELAAVEALWPKALQIVTAARSLEAALSSTVPTKITPALATLRAALGVVGKVE